MLDSLKFAEVKSARSVPIFAENPATSSLAQFDSEILEHFIECANHESCWLELRATCALMRAMIPAPKRGTPQSMWKWATKHDYVGYANMARKAGARHLAMCGGGSADLDDGYSVLWDERFAKRGLIGMSHRVGGSLSTYEIDVVFSIIRGDIRTIEESCECLPILDPYCAMIMGKYTAEEYVMRTWRYYCSRIYMLDAIIYGVAKSGRHELCERLVRERLTLQRNEIEKLSYYLISAKCPKEHSLLDRAYLCYSVSLGDAASTGSREMCEYVREFFGGGIPLFGSMLQGAARCKRGAETCMLAREWYNASRSGTAVFDASRLGNAVFDALRPGAAKSTSEQTYSELVSASMRNMLNEALVIAARSGNREVCELLLDWGATDRAAMIVEAHYVSAYWIADLAYSWELANHVPIGVPRYVSDVCAVVLDKYLRLQSAEKR